MLKNIYITLILFGSFIIIAFVGHSEEDNIITKSELNELASYDPIVVLELFTSQGCSSCPSADLLLQKVKKEYKEEVFALSYHVDYWNYIGWKDPFSNSKYADKQLEYNVKFRNYRNYTPQLVVNGKEHFVGSDAVKMQEKINFYKEKRPLNSVQIAQVSVDESVVDFTYDIKGEFKNKVLRTLLVLDERTTKVKRGENRSRTLQNSNIVVVEKYASIEETSGSMKITIPEIVNQSDRLNLIVLIENESYDITGAVKKSLER
jgi:hypothetical protein